MNLLIETLQKRDKFSSALLYPVYFLLGLYYPLFSFMRKTFPAYMGQLVVFYHNKKYFTKKFYSRLDFPDAPILSLLQKLSI